MNVPSDALLHTTKRFDYNTEYGRLLEITIDRRAKDTFTLQAPVWHTKGLDLNSTNSISVAEDPWEKNKLSLLKKKHAEKKLKESMKTTQIGTFDNDIYTDETIRNSASEEDESEEEIEEEIEEESEDEIEDEEETFLSKKKRKLNHESTPKKSPQKIKKNEIETNDKQQNESLRDPINNNYDLH